MTDIAQEIRGTLKTYCHRSTDDEIERAVQVLEHAFNDTKPQAGADWIALATFKSKRIAQ